MENLIFLIDLSILLKAVEIIKISVQFSVDIKKHDMRWFV